MHTCSMDCLAPMAADDLSYLSKEFLIVVHRWAMLVS
jgi:hypothetical protein